MLPIITNLAQKLTYFENYVAEMRLTNISAIKKKVDNLFSKIDFDYVSGWQILISFKAIRVVEGS